MHADDESASPWRWHADRAPWSRRVASAAEHWEPVIPLSCSPADVRAAIGRAAEADPDQLYDPRVAALTHHHLDGRATRDLNLLAWLAEVGDLDGQVVIDAPTWVWSRTGGAAIARGPHRLGTLTPSIAPASDLGAPWLDPWCTILGYAQADSVPASGQPEQHQEDVVRRGALVGLRAICMLREVAPDVADWLASYTKVLVLLDDTGQAARSASASDLPGLVFADAPAEIALLELLVHESAHHLLYLEETAAPLVDPDDGRRFTSPLRPDARPLRGILLAYHALAYICAFYAALASDDASAAAFDHADVARLGDKAHDAAAVLDDNRAALTDAGVRFVDTTSSVLRHADRMLR